MARPRPPAAEPACAPPGAGGPLCPSSALMDFLGRRHMLHLLRMFGTRPVLRFGEIRAELRSSPNTLSLRLHDLVQAGIVERRAYPGVPPRVEYALSAKGAALMEGVLSFDRFLDAHGPLGRERVKPRRARPAPRVRL